MRRPPGVIPARHARDVLHTYDADETHLFVGRLGRPAARCGNCVHAEGDGTHLRCFCPANYKRWPVEHWQLECVEASESCLNHEADDYPAPMPCRGRYKGCHYAGVCYNSTECEEESC